MEQSLSKRLADAAPDLERILTRGSAEAESPVRFAQADIRRQTVWMRTRDGVRLAADLYQPPVLPAPAVALRTPYGRASEHYVRAALAFAQRGYVAICQDCRGTGESEPDVWDFSVFEPEDGVDFVDWISQQHWFNGFLASFGGSYGGMTQWDMAIHPRMGAIAPEVCGLLVTRSTVGLHMHVNGYSRVVGKGTHRLATSLTEIERLIEPETMAGGYFNAPLRAALPEAVCEAYPHLCTLALSEAKRWLWMHLCALSCAQRAVLLKQLLNISEFTYADYTRLPTFFDCLIPYGIHNVPAAHPAELCQRLHAPAFLSASWYDWNLGDVLPSWEMLRREARPEVAQRSRLLITPAAHHLPGYLEGQSEHPELRHDHRLNVDLLLRWYEAVRTGTTEAWPRLIYYLMGANEWRTASDWPVPEAQPMSLYLSPDGVLSPQAPQQVTEPDRYIYDPSNPTPTVGGSIVSYLYLPGSQDVSGVQRRGDVLTYATAILEQDLDVVGPLRLILYASSSAVDTDFAGRLSDVFPDGRALSLQSGILRARYRHLTGEPELLKPGQIYRLEIDLWATANRFKAGHRLRLDISSADFPRFDRNANRGGELGPALPAQQSIYHDPEHPSHLLLSVLED